MTKANETRDENKKLSEMAISEEDWDRTPKSVQKWVWSLLSRLEKLEKEVGELREKGKQTSRNSSKPPSSDGPEVEKPKKEKGKRKQGGQKGHKGHHKQLKPLEEVDEVHEIKPCECKGCGHALEGAEDKPYRHQVTEIPPVVAKVTEYRLHALGCPECGKQTRAELPEGVPTGTYGPRLQAMTSLLTGQYHLSKREASGIMSDFFQAEVSAGTVSTLEQRTSDAIAEPVQDAREAVQQEAVVNIDETGWYQQHKRAWMWVVGSPQITVFLIRPNRSSQVAKELLGEAFAGIVGSDRWSAYNWLNTKQRQLCWAHLLRDFQAFVDRGGQSTTLGNALLAQSRLMFDAWHRLRDGSLSLGMLFNKRCSLFDRWLVNS